MKVQQPLIIYSQSLGIPENTATRRNLIPEKLSFERTFSPSRCFRLLYFSTLLSAELRTEIMIQVNNSEWHYQQNTAMARNWTKAADSLVVIWVDERKLVAFHFHPYKTTTRNLHQEHRRLCWAPKSTMTTTTESRDVLNGCAVGCCSVFRRTDGFTFIIIELCVLRLFTLHGRPTQTILCCFWGCIQSDHCVWWNRKGTEYKNHKIRTLLLKLQPWITLSWHMFLRNPRILIDWNNSRMIKTKMDSPSSTFYTSSRRLAAQFLKSMNIKMAMCINY